MQIEIRCIFLSYFEHQSVTNTRKSDGIWHEPHTEDLFGRHDHLRIRRTESRTSFGLLSKPLKPHRRAFFLLSNTILGSLLIGDWITSSRNVFL